MSFATILNTSLESKDVQLYYHYDPDDDWEIDNNIITFPSESETNVTFQENQRQENQRQENQRQENQRQENQRQENQRDTFQTVKIFLTEPFHKFKSDHSHELVIQNKDKSGKSIFIVFFIHSQSIYPSSELDMLFTSDLEDDFLEIFLTKHLYDQPNVFYKTKHSKVIVLPSVVRVNSLTTFPTCSRKQLKHKYKEIYDTDFYEPIFSLFRTKENDEEPYQNKILAENIPIKTQLIVEGFFYKRSYTERHKLVSKGTVGRTGHSNRGRGVRRRLRLGKTRHGSNKNKSFSSDNYDISGQRYQECTLLKDDGKTVYMDTAVVPLGANAYVNGSALFMSFLYFLIIFLVVCNACPYLIIMGLVDNKESINIMLMIINYIFLIIGFILIIVGLVDKKSLLNKRILYANLGLYFIIIYLCSIMSSFYAFKSTIKYNDNYDFSRVTYTNIAAILTYGVYNTTTRRT